MGKKYNIKKVQDHKGVWYNSLVEMCDAYKINCDTYLQRIARGKTKEEALTTPVRPKGRHIDPFENQFSSFEFMCEFHGQPAKRVRRRLSLGWPLKKALETPLLRDRRHK